MPEYALFFMNMNAVRVNFDTDTGADRGVVRGLNEPFEAPEVHNDVILACP